MDQQTLTYKEKVTYHAIQLYEFYERDYTDFTNSRLRAIRYCDTKISSATEQTQKLFWLDVKTELQNSKL